MRAWIAIALVAGCGDNKLGVVHEPPVVTIVEPTDGSTFFEGESIGFRAQVVPASSSDDVTQISTRWSAGTTTICDSAPVPGDGYAVWSYAFDSAGEQTITVTATDPELDTVSATIAVEIVENQAPTIEIASPADAASFDPGELIVVEADVADEEDPSDELVVTVESSLQGDLGKMATPASDGSWTDALSLENGDHLLTFRVTDTGGKTGQASLTVSVNGRPGAPTVHIDPDPAPSGEALEATIDADAVDPEGDPVTYTYDWFLGGTLYQSGPNPKIASGITVRGDFWEVDVRADDGGGAGAPGTASITISNSPPSIASVPLTPSSPGTDDDVVAAPSGWFDQDGDTERYRYAWTRNGTLDAAETTDTYPHEKTERGDTLQAEVTPYDSFEDGAPVLSPTVTIGNATPTAPTVEITPSSPAPEDDLVCQVVADSTDADGDPITYAWSWYQNGTVTSITGYVVDAAYTDDGDQWECRVTPTDGMSTGPYGSALVDVIDSTPPDPPVLEIPDAYRNETSIELTGDCEAACSLTFTCTDSSGSWTESDTCAVDGTLDHTVTLTRGETTTCTATCTDAAGNTSKSSNTVSTEVCDPYDTYEDSTGNGDTVSASIDAWSAVPDDASTTITIQGNILEAGDVDWYVISTSDDLAADVAAKNNDYNFHVEMTAGATDYAMAVYKGSSVASGYPSTAECSGSTYTEYQDYVSTRPCSSGSADGYNNCEDMSDDYYIEVTHNATSYSCQYYELTITNGVW